MIRSIEPSSDINVHDIFKSEILESIFKFAQIPSYFNTFLSLTVNTRYRPFIISTTVCIPSKWQIRDKLYSFTISVVPVNAKTEI
jgi:hypothetical protein